MAERDMPRHVAATAADLAAVVERMAGDLSLAEEPAGFVTALEAAAPDERDAG